MKRKKWMYCLFASVLFFVGGKGRMQKGYADNTVTQLSSTPMRIQVSEYNQKDVTILLNSDWRFKLGDVTHAQEQHFDDSTWEQVQLPHDYSLTQDYTTQAEAESGYKLGGIGWYRKTFTLGENLKQERFILSSDGAYMNTEVYVNGQKVGMHPYGYTAFSFDITPYLQWQQTNVLAIKTDNPVPSSRWYSGSGLYRDISLKVVPNVHFKTFGIVMKSPDLASTHLLDSGSAVELSANIINDTSKVANVYVKHTLFEKQADGSLGPQVASGQNEVQISAQQEKQVVTYLSVIRPKLWSVDNPQLYVLRTELVKDDERVQTLNQEVGFRFTAFDANTGFTLNGSALKLKGVSMHHDQGALGSAAYYDAIERQFLMLKDMGANAVRVTHNPSSRAMKDVANRLGILLIDEAFDTWHYAKNGNYNDYAKWFNHELGADGQYLEYGSTQQTWAEYDAKQMVRSGINDPSIIMWSTGNEVMEGFSGNVSTYPQVLHQIGQWIDEIDGTRPITLGDNKLKDNWNESIDMANVLTQKTGLQGIVGYNYANAQQYDAGHQRYPHWIIYGSETASAVNSRGVYDVKGNAQRLDKQLTSYDQSAVGWGHVASQAWYDVVTRDFVAGEFVWTGFDYLGEPTPWNGVGVGAVGEWPAPKSSYFGIIDTAGLPKDSYYFYQSQWKTDTTTLHVLPVWHSEMVSTDEQGQVEVVVYSNASKVKLIYLAPDGTQSDLGEKTFTKQTTPNGVTYQIYQGADKQTQDHQNLYLTWQVPYRNGTLKAIAYDENGQEITHTTGRHTVRTFGQASELVAQVCQKDEQVTDQSLAYVEISVQDEQHQDVVNANPIIDVSVTGPAKLVGLDNGNACDHQSYQESNRRAFNGKLVAIIKMTGESGEVKVHASSPSLNSSTATFQVTKKDNTPNIAHQIDSYVLAKTIYLKRNHRVMLPETIRVRYKDNHEEDKTVVWQLTPELSQKFMNGESGIVEGKIEGVGISLTVYVSVIDQVAAMENYSGATEKGVLPILPETASAYTIQGTLTSAQFPVSWQPVSKSAFHATGIVSIQGQADVLGEKLPISATIRVAEKDKHIHQNVAPVVVKLTEDTPSQLVSDHLMAIKDGSTTVLPHESGGVNASVWSNYHAAQAGIKTSRLNFEYDTAQNIAQVSLYHNQDSWSARLPKAISFAWKASVTGSFQTIDAQVVEETTIGSLTKTVYRLSQSVPAVVFSIQIENSDEKVGNRQACTVLSEVELHTVLEEFKLKKTADLATWQIDQQFASAKQLASRIFETSHSNVKVIAENHLENVAVTILPPYQNVIKIFTKSEDKTQQLMYHVLLNANDGDIPVEQIKTPVKDSKTDE